MAFFIGSVNSVSIVFYYLESLTVGADGKQHCWQTYNKPHKSGV
jgi:hypothetical protein